MDKYLLKKRARVDNECISSTNTKDSRTEIFRKLADSRGFGIYNVPADGNCFAHAVEDQLTYEGGIAEIRSKAIEHIKKNKNALDPNFLLQNNFKNVDDYVEKQGKNRAWFDEIMIRAVSEELQIKICILHDNGHETMIEPSSNINIKKTIMLGLIGEMHYVSLHEEINHVPSSEANASEDISEFRSFSETDKTCNLEMDSETYICPSVCTSEQFTNWQMTRPWLSAKRIGSSTLVGISCNACSKVGNISKCVSVEKSKERLTISPEWLAGVTASNWKKLHDKMSQHSNSKAHLFCLEHLKTRQSEELEKSFSKSRNIWKDQNADRITDTCKIFRTVYLISWKHLSFRTHPYLIELQQQNGISLGKMLVSHQSCSNIANFIANRMTNILVKFILSQDSVFSLLMDESTTISNETALIIYIRCMDPSGNPTNAFLVLCELSNGTTGAAIAVTLLKKLEEMGISESILKQRLLGFCTDGASNLHGCVKGALQLISQKLDRSDLILFHCMNHKLELALHDAVSSVNMVSHLRIFMDSLYTYYSRSPEHCRQLEKVSMSLGVELKKIGKIFDVRWLSSSYNTINAVYNSLPAIIAHLRESGISAVLSKDRAKAQGMVKKMEAWIFIAEIALMRDILDALKSLSLYLQSREASIINAKDRFGCTIRVLSAMKSVDGITLQEVNKQVNENGMFNEILVTHYTPKEVAIFTELRVRFLQALIDNLTSRFPSKDLLDYGAVLNETSWPYSEDERILFGDAQVIQLARYCQINERAVLDDFRKYKYNTKDIGPTLAELHKRINIMPISSAECERGFSSMNLNDTPVRNRLTIETLSSLLFIKVNGPPPSAFNPVPYAEQWLRDGRHSTTDLATGKKAKNSETISPISMLYQ